MKLLVFVILWSQFFFVVAVHLKGTWNKDEKLRVIAKFGIRQMEVMRKENTKGFIYGNITMNDATKAVITNSNRAGLFIVPESMISSIMIHSEYSVSCGSMLANISQFAFEPKCLTSGKRSDMLRWIPCPKDKLCSEEDNPALVIPGYQFTFKIEEPVSPEFWYVVLLSCSLTPECNWTQSTRDYDMDYDLWLVNGHPEAKGDIFSKQFSFEEQDVIYIYMFALQMYIVLVLCQFRAASITRQSRIPKRQRFLNYIIGLKTAALILQATDTFVFAVFGTSTIILMFIGELLRVFAVCLLCLLLILLSRGWSLNQANSYSHRVQCIWAFVSFCHVLFFVYGYINTNDNVQLNGFNYLSSHGIVLIRLIQGAWFLFEVKKTIWRELDEDRAVFLVHFGAAYMVWFVYLLGLGLIASMISELWRLKIVLAITTFSNFIAIACLVHIFWPTGSNRKFFTSDVHVHRHIDRTSSAEMDEYDKMLIANDDDDDAF